MIRMSGLCAAIALLLAAPLAASATELKVLGAKVELPFAWKLVETGENFEKDRDGLQAVEGREIEVMDGPLQGMHLLVVGSYWSPSFTNADFMRKTLRELAEKDAGNALTRDTGELRLDGYTFHFTDRRDDDKGAKWPETMALAGEVSAAMYTLQILAKETKALTPEVEQALKTSKIDFETLMRVRGRFDDEAHAAIEGTRLETPLGPIQLGKKHLARLVFSSVRRDGDGRQLARTRTYVAQRAPGFWNAPNPVVMSFACMANTPGRLEEMLSLYDDDTSRPVEERSVQTGGRLPAKFLGTDAVQVTGKGPVVLGARPSIRRLTLAQDGTIYAFTVSRDGGSGVEGDVEKLLASAQPRCRTDLALPGESKDAPRPATGTDSAPRLSSR